MQVNKNKLNIHTHDLREGVSNRNKITLVKEEEERARRWGEDVLKNYN